MKRLIDENAFPPDPEMTARFNAVYGGRSPQEVNLIDQMTWAWSRTRGLMYRREDLLKTTDMTDPKAVRSMDLELAALADGALTNWRNIGEMLGTSRPEDIAAAMDAKGEELRRIGWIAPTRPCIRDYRALKALQAKRDEQSKS